MTTRELTLGALLTDERKRSETALKIDAEDLVTHGVVVGMTGSGKTGLSVVLLEELLGHGVPALIIDPKGDMTNLALSFPELRPEDFQRWTPANDAAQAEAQARQSKEQLASWGIGSEALNQYTASRSVQILTPGSTAGTPVNILGDFSVPVGVNGEAASPETVLDELDALVTSLLQLVGLKGDPLTSREYVLLSNLIQHAWSNAHALDLAGLIQQVQKPPLRNLGVFELESFFPEKDRAGLAMRLNSLLANPSFANWMSGEPLDIDRMLWAEDGSPKACVVYVAHLSDTQRQFVVTAVLSRLVSWMRRQPGSSKLRALLYMDEVFGFCPPSAQPPSKKPILTLLKQARAFGLGTVLATQNPMDLDYRAMSNCGTWLIGRLQTERDKARVLEALSSANGSADVAALGDLLGGLNKREFLAYRTRSADSVVFTSRYAMSYLRGPLTLPELSLLADEPGMGTAAAGTAAPDTAASDMAAPDTQRQADELPRPPDFADKLQQGVLLPRADWSKNLGPRVALGGAPAGPGSAAGPRLEAALCARVEMLFDERNLGLAYTEAWEAVYFPLGAGFDAASAQFVDYDPQDFGELSQESGRYVPPALDLKSEKARRAVERDVQGFIHKSQRLELLRHREFKLCSRPGETEAQFRERLQSAAQRLINQQSEKIHAKTKTKLRTLQQRLERAELKLENILEAQQAAKSQELISGATSFLGMLFGGSSKARSVAARAMRGARGASSRRGRTKAAGARVSVAEQKLEDTQQDIEELEADTLSQLEELELKFNAKVEDVERVQVGLEKGDINVSDLRLVWVPMANALGGA